MKDDKKKDRRAAIEAAAYGVLEARGYEGASMSAIAKAARASHETLYTWYGDKVGLFRALVARNASDVSAQLDAALAGKADVEATLRAIGPLLLEAVLGPRAVALNRAAAADRTGALGKAIAEAGRDQIAPKLASLMAQAKQTGVIRRMEASDATDLFVDLLIGDLQIRRVVGRMPMPEPDALASRAERAVDRLLQLAAEEAPDAVARTG